ncbi:uncharacterized protein LOC119746407 [Patiria miniata]|uniref:Uncharacterized protein n=1 Tax=Patiria miniata TaxID=46514 RepID=A0A914BTD3_PATMI|nr:uncharacterized protein LOC119746407 [Patiria miniata]
MSDDCSILPMRDYCLMNQGESARVVCKDIACPPPELPGPPPECSPYIYPDYSLLFLLGLLGPLVVCVIYKLYYRSRKRGAPKNADIDLDKAHYPPTVSSSRHGYSFDFQTKFKKSKEIPEEELSKKASSNKGPAGQNQNDAPKKEAAAGPKCTSTTEDERSGFERPSGAGKVGPKNEAGVRPRSIANNGSGPEKEAKVRPQSIANNARVKPHPREPSKKDNRGSTVKEDNMYTEPSKKISNKDRQKTDSGRKTPTDLEKK